MNPDKYERISSLFLQVCDLPPEEQLPALEEFCRGDPDLQSEIKRMLVHDSRKGLNSPAARFNLQKATGDAVSGDSEHLPNVAGLATGRVNALPSVPGYRILGRLGQGGMGVVWRAVQLGTNREVAMKQMHAAGFGSLRSQARFEREVELAARLQHPHIARVYDSGVSDDVSYYAMELIDGVELDQYCEDAKLDQRQILQLILDVCQAVQHAHVRGVIHRDLKPSNILVSADGKPHVVDFGLARALLEETASEMSVSVHGHLMGTPAYMSPEQAAGRPDQLDTRTDVYSLGVILFRLLTKQSPHDLTGTPLSVIRRIAEEDARRPREANKSIDSDLDALLLRALARNRDARYATAGELAADIENYLTGEPLSARPLSAHYLLRKRLRKHKTAVAVLAAVFLLIVAGVTAYIVAIKAEQKKTIAARDLAERWSSVLRIQAADRAMHTAWQTTDISEAKRLLDLCPENYRGWAWHRLNWMRDRSETTLGPFDEDIRQLILTPDGSRFIAVLGTYSFGSASRMVIFDAKTFRRLMTLRGHDGLIFRAGITPNGAEIYSGGRDRTLRRWNAHTGELIESIDVGTEITDFGFTPDGRYVIWADIQRGLIVRDTESNVQRTISLSGQHGQDYRLAVSPDGRRVAWLTREWGGTDTGHLKMIDLVTDQELWKLEAPASRALLFVRDATSLIVTGTLSRIGAGNIVQLNASTGALIKTWIGQHGLNIGDMVLSPDGTRLASVGYLDQRIILWDVNNGSPLSMLLGHGTELYSVMFTADGKRLISGGNVSMSPVMKIWNIAQCSESQILARHEAPTIAAMSPDGRSVASIGPHSVVLHDPHTGRQYWQVDFSLDEMSPEYARIAMTDGIDTPAGKIAIMRPLPREMDDEPVCRLTILDGASGSIAANMDVSGIPASVEFSHDGQQLAVGVMEKENKDEPLMPSLDGIRILILGATAVAFSPDDRFVAAVDREKLLIWDGVTGKVVRRKQYSGKGINHDVEYLPDGRILIGQDRDTVRIVNSQTLEVASEFHSREHFIRSAVFNENGQVVIVRKSHGEVQVFDSQLDVLLTTIDGSSIATFAKCTPDGRTIVTAHQDGTVRLWMIAPPRTKPNAQERNSKTTEATR